MIRSKAIFVFAWLPIIALMSGCRKSTPEPASPPPASAAPQKSTAPDDAIRVHWLGKNAIADDRNATNFMALWNLPESVKLESQTLDKLCAVPWRMLGATNASANLLRPLLDDVVAQECYLEVRKAASALDKGNEIVFSVRLNADRADLWQSKLATVMQSLGAAPVGKNPSNWSVNSNNRSNLVELARAGDWSVLAVARDHNALLDETLGRINSQRTPVVDSSTNAFLEGIVDLARVAGHSGSNALPKVSFALKMDKGSVATTGEFLFPGQGASRLPSWNIPTNLISESAVTITAIRGFARFFQSSKLWADLNAGSPPDQCFLWATRDYPMQTYCAVPMSNASNAVAHISEFALRKQGPPWLTNMLAGFQKSQTSDGLSWHGFPYLTPFLRSASDNDQNLIMAGFLNVDTPPGPPAAGVVEGILSNSNLVYYDREQTGYRVEQWIQLGQALRFISGVGQLPGDSASFEWLKALGSRLGSGGTDITEVAPGKFSLARKSDLGFTAVELHLLADWFASPEFPFGTYSTLVRASGPPPM